MPKPVNVETCHPKKVNESKKESPERSVKGTGYREAPCTERFSPINTIAQNRGEREWLLRVGEREGNWKSPFLKFGNGMGIEKAHSRNSGTGRELKKPIPEIREREGNKKIHSQISGMGREWKNPIPKIREREGNEKNPFPKFGNGKGMKKIHSRNSGTGREWKNPFPKFGNGKGMKKIHSRNSGTGREWKNPFPKFGKGNQRPPFLGMTGNGNSRSPLGLQHLLHLDFRWRWELSGVWQVLPSYPSYLPQFGEKLDQKIVKIQI